MGSLDMRAVVGNKSRKAQGATFGRLQQRQRE